MYINAKNGFREPTEREKRYIAKAVISKYEMMWLYAIVISLGLIILTLLILMLWGTFQNFGSEFSSILLLLLLVIIYLQVSLVMTLQKGRRLRVGEYEVLEGTAIYYSVYHKKTVRIEKKPEAYGQVTYYHVIRNFVSSYGEPVNLNSKVCILPKYTYVHGDWGDGKEFPMLLIRIKGKIEYVIPDWKNISNHPKYGECTSLYKDMFF